MPMTGQFQSCKLEAKNKNAGNSTICKVEKNHWKQPKCPAHSKLDKCYDTLV